MALTPECHRLLRPGGILRIGVPRLRSLPFGETVLDEAPDSEHRRDETLYVEAVKSGLP